MARARGMKAAASVLSDGNLCHSPSVEVDLLQASCAPCNVAHVIMATAQEHFSWVSSFSRLETMSPCASVPSRTLMNRSHRMHGVHRLGNKLFVDEDYEGAVKVCARAAR